MKSRIWNEQNQREEECCNEEGKGQVHQHLGARRHIIRSEKGLSLLLEKSVDQVLGMEVHARHRQEGQNRIGHQCCPEDAVDAHHPDELINKLKILPICVVFVQQRTNSVMNLPIQVKRISKHELTANQLQHVIGQVVLFALEFCILFQRLVREVGR